MNIENILKPLTKEQLQTLSRADLVELVLGEQDLRAQAEKWRDILKEEKYLIGEKFIIVKNGIFGKSSEKSPGPTPNKGGKGKKGQQSKDKRTLLPSERYPNATIINQDIEFEILPNCSCCGKEMEDSGMVETREILSVLPKRYIIKRQNHHKYKCGHCHGDIKTTPTPPKIKPGSSYDDALIIDVGMSKYCDLIPVERYAMMAQREGLLGLPPHSLIELTHYLADFVTLTYELIKQETLLAVVLYADETFHRMLEGDERSNWFLWGFSWERGTFFECHNTRSGDVAANILANSKCKYLVSDVYSGYAKATNLCNCEREKTGRLLVKNCYCNAHSRRKFVEALLVSPAAQFFIDRYQKIYKIEKDLKDKTPQEKEIGRAAMVPLFEEMRAEGQKLLAGISSKSALAGAINYFLKNYDGLTIFLKDGRLPVDNNHEERLLRNPVIGRKTWLGTHSKRGAETAAKLFTIVESCKLNNLNPREYLERLVGDIHQGKAPFTPWEFLQRKRQESTLSGSPPSTETH